MELPDSFVQSALDPIAEAWNLREGLRPAAVLAPLFRTADGDCVLFTKRRSDLPHHAGQISFPGGAREGEEGPLRCALRETNEEIGLAPERVTVLGALPARLSTAGFWVQVYVGRFEDRQDLRPDPREVERLLEIPVAELLDEPRWESKAVTVGARRYPESPHFRHGDDLVWGLTGRFLWDLVQRLRGTGA